jgi:hypothetical protein
VEPSLSLRHAARLLLYEMIFVIREKVEGNYDLLKYAVIWMSPYNQTMRFLLEIENHQTLSSEI